MCRTCVTDPKVQNTCFRVGKDVERCRHCAEGNKSCFPVPRRDWARANEVIHLKEVARVSRSKSDIKVASKAAIRLRKYFATSNSIAKKESNETTSLDELRIISRQLRLQSQLMAIQSGLDPSVADEGDGPLVIEEQDEDLWEDSSSFESIDSDAYSGGAPSPRSSRVRPPPDLPPYRKPRSRRTSARATPRSRSTTKMVSTASSLSPPPQVRAAASEADSYVPPESEREREAVSDEGDLSPGTTEHLAKVRKEAGGKAPAPRLTPRRPRKRPRVSSSPEI